MAVTVVSVQRAAPDIIVATILDGPIVHGEVIDLTTYPSSTAWSQGATNGTLADMSSAAYDTNTTFDGMIGLIGGLDKDIFRSNDTAPTEYLDRDAIKNVAGYGTIGGLTVTAIYYENFGYDEGYSLTQGAPLYQMEHLVYIHLSGNLADGDHTILWPDLIGSGKNAVPADHAFTLDDKDTICPGIHINQNGYGLADERKLAYYNQRIPGYENGTDTEGVFDPTVYGAWTGTCYLIDKNDAVQHTFTAELRTGPTSAEPYGDLFDVANNAWTADLNDKIAIAAITKANPGVVTTDGPHGLSNGDKVYLAGILGMDSANTFRRVRTYDVVTVVDDDEFSFVVNTTSFGTYTSGGFVHAVNQINLVGTYNYNLDIGALTLPPGDYRIWIPGFGSSPVFRLDTAVWARLADYGMRGIVAHYCGVTLDDRFGYERPTNLKPISEGGNITMLQSLLPYSGWSSEGGGFVAFANGGQAPWITATEVPVWGGIMDAGDTDRRTSHLQLARLLLDVFEIVGSSANTSSFNVPKMSTLITDGTYAGTDDLPDPVQIAMWIIDFHRRTQAVDGSICGGAEQVGSPRRYEPTYKSRLVNFAYSNKDPLGAYLYAGAAAHLSRVLADEGYATLAGVYQTSAVAAWGYAESVYSDLDTLWAAEIAIADAAGEFASTSWATYKAGIAANLYSTTGSGGDRVHAASSLYRLIDDAEYKDIVEDWWDGTASGLAYGGNGGGYGPGRQLWDYANVTHAGVNASYQASMKAMINSTADTYIASKKDNDDIAYVNTRHVSTQAYGGFGLGSVPTRLETEVLIWAHINTGTDLYAQVLQAGAGFTLGANPLNVCMMIGLGQRNFKNVLHEDTRAMGRRPPDGLCIYGAHHWMSWVVSNLYGAVSYAHWPMPKGAITSGDCAFRLVEPEPGFRPFRSWLGNGSFDIPSMEYTNHQTHGNLAAIGFYLQGKEGAANFTFQPKRIRLRLNSAAV